MLGRVEDSTATTTSNASEAGAQSFPGLLVYRFDAPPFFVNAEYLGGRVLEVAPRLATSDWLVLNAEAWTSLIPRLSTR